MNTKISTNLIKLKYLKCLESNYLNFYPSRKTFVKVGEGATPFEVRYCPALVAKKAEVSVTKKTAEDGPVKNPFLPFDQNLFISDLNASHVLIFNKFCLVPEHLLIITRQFVEQAAEYCREDFEAVGDVLEGLRDANPLAFYNSGADAGASQAHRHFQVIPTEISPIAEHIEAVDKFDEPFTIPIYSSFLHGCIRRPSNQDYNQISDWHLGAYQKLKHFCDKESAYNLIWTEDWMLIIPRRKEFSDDGLNSLNAMAFAGYFLVMDEAHLHQFDVIGCLQQVTFPQ